MKARLSRNKNYRHDVITPAIKHVNKFCEIPVFPGNSDHASIYLVAASGRQVPTFHTKAGCAEAYVEYLKEPYCVQFIQAEREGDPQREGSGLYQGMRDRAISG